MANVLVIGAGGREHAIVWKLSQSPQVANIYVAPGSHAIQGVEKAKNVTLDVTNFDAIAKFCQESEVNLVAVGPEDPLANGIADHLIETGIKVFGPQKDAARIESDKEWAKKFMDKYGIPTAKWRSFRDSEEAKTFIQSAEFPALVVKASGLAAGKGVVVASNISEACQAVDSIITDKQFGDAGETIVVEEILSGEEVSVLAFCDGNGVLAMLPAQDHKRIFDADRGPNTGGMGAYCPCPLLSPDELKYVYDHILLRAVAGFHKENLKYVGVLYAGLMLTRNGPRVLEFNCRFGDPETEVILPLLESDLYVLMAACCNGTLRDEHLQWKQGQTAVGVVMASRGYPETSSKGQVIFGIEDVIKDTRNLVFHCGTSRSEDRYTTNGGRVLIAVSVAPQLTEAAAHATKMCEIISFEGKQYRKDIAHKGICRSILLSGKLTYKSSGVDITAGNNLVASIKSFTKSTDRKGVVGSIGGFGGVFDLKLAEFDDPLLVSGTDGVGTKLKIAQEMGIHNTIGIDLVAMCVNDVLANGAEPLFFLDYFACGKLDLNVAKQVIGGIAEGCKQAGCALIGGETAEMPDMYPEGDYDLAGFAVGAVEKRYTIPDLNRIKVGDLIIGLPSTGVHSNGFSLVRKVMKIAGVNYRDIAAFSLNVKSYGEEFLTPTKIYVSGVIEAVKTGKVKAFAHVTGGGLVENVPRVLRKDLGVLLDARYWTIPSLFGWLAAAGGINEQEMLRTFNCGIGGVLVVSKGNENEILAILKHYDAAVIGEVVAHHKDEERVVVKNFIKQMEHTMRQFLPAVMRHLAKPKKRVGVLISGGGTNLQALIDATADPIRQMGCEIVLVISNKTDVEGLERAEKAKIPTKVVSHKDYHNRVDFDRAMHSELVAAGVDIVCLAGFMRILSGEFTNTWRGRLINIHPSLLPLFKGTHAQKQALEAGVRVTGCTIHFVVEDIDAGGIIVQKAVEIKQGDTEPALVDRIKAVEHEAYPQALKLVATGRCAFSDEDKIVWS